MFYLHFLIGLISSKKYCRVAKNLVPVFKGIIQVKFYFYEIFTKIQMKEESLNLLKTQKTRFRETEFREILEGYAYP